MSKIEPWNSNKTDSKQRIKDGTHHLEPITELSVTLVHVCTQFSNNLKNISGVVESFIWAGCPLARDKMWCFWSLLCSNPTLFVKIDRHTVAFIGMGPAVKMIFGHQIDVYVLTVIIKEFTRPPMSSFVTSRTVQYTCCVLLHFVLDKRARGVTVWMVGQ